MATYTGTNGDNTINGTNSSDTMYGLGGDDRIRGRGGSDTIYGGTGNDELEGGDGDDTILGENGNDLLSGDDGNDDLKGGSGHDALFGGVGNDTLTGGGGYDAINGGAGTDTAIYSGSLFEYSIYHLGSLATVIHNGVGGPGSGADGADLLALVERLQFSDYTIDLTANNGPIAFDDAVALTEDAGSASGSVVDNDYDFEGDTLTVTPGVFTGTYGTLTLNGDGTYSYVLSANSQALAQGQSAQDSFTYTVSDGSASDTANVVFTIGGVNDAPVAAPDSASTGENASVLVDVLVNDSDVDDGAVLTVTAASAPMGQGSASVVGNQVQFDPGTDFDYLDTGDSANVIVSYTTSDEHGATANSTVTITVSGNNDAPVANDDTAATDENTQVTGNVLANDTDPDDPLTVTNAATFLGAYGTLVLAANGSYTYTPGAAAQALTNGQTANDVFTYIASDGTVSDTATLTVTVTGLSGVPDANDDTASTTEDSPVSGNVLTNDTDAENDPLTVTDPGTYVGTYGTLTLAADGSYTYTPDASADGLAAGESAQDVFNYTASDGTASDTATLTVTVDGTNDLPTIDPTGTDDSGSVTELPDGDPGEGTTTHTDSGAVAFDDLDLSDTHSASFTPQGAFYLGTFSLDPVDQTGDSVGWDFTVSDAALEGLSEGEIRIQTYEVQIDDGQGGTATQDVTITITGAGVGAGPQTVWYIDNSAVGSTNVGTADNPYTSIAAFNAAQGSLGGPQPGHTVHLLAGTGTGIYAEVDGINLLDGQILVGDATGPVRPTIVTTAGDGINVAENNDVSGIDIGSTSGAGIADSGGSVGALTISDVAKSGTGQIVDIDEGGTLNVVLTSAGSLGSDGGAIDLAGVSGDFTVSGATTISGVHSGGGIVVTGSSVDATFGAGTVSTGDADAVSFTGNSGTLTLGGNFDIATTTGAGLDASGGGTVSAIGSGNSIVSVGGVALNVVDTVIGGGGLTFESISANGGTNGIVLTNTGNLAGLHVVGDGGGFNNGSGGAIQNMSGDGILLTNTEDVRLASMTVSGNDGDGIGGSGVNGFVLGGLTITGNGDSTATDEAGINIAGLTGSASGGARPTLISNSVISNNYEFEVQITNSSGTLTNLQLLDSEVSSDGATGVHGNLVNFLGQAGATMGLTVSGTMFDGNTTAGALTGTAVHVDTAGTTLVEIQTSMFVSNNSAVNMSTQLGGNLTFNVHNSQMTGNRSTAINVFTNTNATGTINGTLANNTIGTEDVAGSGSTLGRGIQVSTPGGGTTNLLIDGNTVQSVTSVEAISVVDTGTPGIVNVTITDNVLRDIGGRGILVQTVGTGTLNSSIAGNFFDNVTGAGGTVMRINEGTGTALNVSQDAPDPAADLNDIDDANGIADTSILVNGSPQWNSAAPTLPSAPSLPLMASGDAPEGRVELLGYEELQGIVSSAILHWQEAGASAAHIRAMSAVTFDIADLAGRALGSTREGHITIDVDAAGFGWFVDTTPNDAEYGSSGADLIAAPDTAEASRMDLLTAVMHELGHQIGLVDVDKSGSQDSLMFATLDPGERRLPEETFSAGIAEAPGGFVEWGMLALQHAQEQFVPPEVIG